MMYRRGALAVLCLGPLFADGHYDYFRAGSQASRSGATAPGFLLAGGGNTPREAWRWFAAKAGGGDAVVLRASGADAMNSVLLEAGPLNSVSTFVTRSREAASDPFLVDAVRQASLIFIAGGDQWNYIRMWKGTPLENAINERIAAGVPIGGNSAGLAILGEHGFSAEQDTVTSKQALADPFDPHVTLVTFFLRIPLLKGVVTDTHFAKRGRMGRLLVFLARLPRGTSAVAVDEDGAVLLEPDGEATFSGSGHAYFIRPSEAPEICRPGSPLTMRGFRVYRIDRSGGFDVKRWSGTSGRAYELSVIAGEIEPASAVY